MGGVQLFSYGLVVFIIFNVLPRCSSAISGGMLYPRESESRSIKELNGMWNFRADMSPNRMEGFDMKWFSRPLSQTGDILPMPVPASYNDIYQNKSLRDFVGWVWYDREVYATPDLANKRVVLRVDSAHYNAIVWLNSVQVMSHSGGHLPFEAEVTKYLHFDQANLLTIAVNNTLTKHTLPPGSITYRKNPNKYPPGYFVQNLQMDFFNYAGIHRSVRLYTTPKVYIDDITVITRIEGTTGVVNFTVVAKGASQVTYKIKVLDKVGNIVAISNKASEQLKITNAHFWWPYTMNPQEPAYLYTLQVTVESSGTSDVYRLPFGIRTVNATNTQLLINNKPFYCQGVAKHEDSDIRGKGLDFALIAKDFSLLKWLGANCFRTSHYPYAEEILDQADQQGIVVIDESPGVGIKGGNMDNISLAHHLEVMEEMYRRDKNRPAVAIWSVANEPESFRPQSEPYFKQVITHIKHLDNTRLVSFVMGGTDFNTDRAAKFVDILCVNRYYGWYEDLGHTEFAAKELTHDLTEWFKTFHKPVMITEYGADTIAGLHKSPSVAFTEEYQVEFLQQYHTVFDTLKEQFFVGEMVWNFADFQTTEALTRVDGNKKGLFTRQRQPKFSAHMIRKRYHDILAGGTSKQSQCTLF